MKPIILLMMLSFSAQADWYGRLAIGTNISPEAPHSDVRINNCWYACKYIEGRDIDVKPLEDPIGYMEVGYRWETVFTSWVHVSGITDSTDSSMDLLLIGIEF